MNPTITDPEVADLVVAMSRVERILAKYDSMYFAAQDHAEEVRGQKVAAWAAQIVVLMEKALRDLRPDVFTVPEEDK